MWDTQGQEPAARHYSNDGQGGHHWVPQCLSCYEAQMPVMSK